MTLNDTAQAIIDYWVKTDYAGDRAALVGEVGNLDNYAYRIAETIERYGLDTSDIEHCAGLLELRM